MTGMALVCRRDYARWRQLLHVWLLHAAEHGQGKAAGGLLPPV